MDIQFACIQRLGVNMKDCKNCKDKYDSFYFGFLYNKIMLCGIWNYVRHFLVPPNIITINK